MRPCLLLFAMSVPGLSGCGAKLPEAADAEGARQALRTGLDLWKSGETIDSLQKRSPPIYFKDSDWKAGWQLKNFRTTLDDEPYGQQRRLYVHLSLQKSGKATAKEVQYLVDTTPAIVVVRVED
jgi:hypothetical protein